MIMDIKTMLNGHTDDPLKHAAGLSAVWQKCMSELCKSECRLLFPKEHGQLGRLRKSLGMKQATEVVEYVIRNWRKFAQKTANVGSNVFPQKPSVGWLYQYHAIAVLMLHEELQSIAKKKAAVEQALKESQAKEAAKAMPELKSKEPSVIPLQLTPEQLNAFFKIDDPANEAWADKVTEKYGQWRPAKPDEKGILCDVELKEAA
jgi:hypothetical protein